MSEKKNKNKVGEAAIYDARQLAFQECWCWVFNILLPCSVRPFWCRF